MTKISSSYATLSVTFIIEQALKSFKQSLTVEAVSEAAAAWAGLAALAAAVSEAVAAVALADPAAAFAASVVAAVAAWAALAAAWVAAVSCPGAVSIRRVFRRRVSLPRFWGRQLSGLRLSLQVSCGAFCGNRSG